MKEQQRRELAWVGDAVLALVARQWILEQVEIKEKDRTECFVALTSNQFLSQFGEPTSVEAQIGKTYEESGLEAAEAWFGDVLVPAFKKTKNNRLKGSKGAKK